MWSLRKWLIKKLAGRQTVVVNARMMLPIKGLGIKSFDIGVKGHHKKYLVDNVDVVDNFGKEHSY